MVLSEGRRAAIRAPTLLLVAHTALGLTVSIRLGFYHPAALACAGVAALLVVAVAAGARREPGGDALPGAGAVALWLVAGALGSFSSPSLAFGDVRGFAIGVAVWQLAVLLLGVGLLLGSERLLRPSRAWGAIVAAIAVVATGLRLLVPLVSPEPAIDVFTMREDGARALLRGANPYETPVRDPFPGGSEQYGYTLEHYAYPPANLYVDGIAVGLLGDVRYASALAELLACGVLVGVVRRRRPAVWRSPAALLTAAPLLYPKGPFVTEQAWTEPLLLASLVLWWGLCACGRDRPAALVFGFLLALKQYLVFFALAFLGYALGRRRPGWVALPPLVVAGTVLPFLVWDADAILGQAVGWMWNESFPFRADTLSLPGLTYRELQLLHPGWLGLVAGLAVAALLAWRWARRGPRFAWREDAVLFGVATTLTTFVLGPQAFANYYYFLGNALILPILGAGLASGPAADREDGAPEGQAGTAQEQRVLGA